MADIELKTMSKIEALVGAEDFKERMRELAAVIPGVIDREIPDTLFLRNYIFSIDQGCGFSTCLGLMKELMEECGNRNVLVTEEYLGKKGIVVTGSDGQGVPFLRAVDGEIVGIDISEWLGKLNMPEFRRTLINLRKKDEKTVYVFRIPPVEPRVMKKVHDAIYDVMFVTDVTFRPLTADDCFRYASSVAGKKGFVLDEEAASSLEKKIDEERSDGKFYGFDTVRKVIDEVIFNKLLLGAKDGTEDRRIGKDDVDAVTVPGERKRDPLDAFDEYIGMENVKRQISEIVSQIKYLRSRRGAAMPCIHMKFVGNPGTGKTTAARIVGEALGEYGILKNGSFFEYTGRALIGEHIGETEARTSEICRTAYGSVLFIDEAYSLCFSDSDSRDFGNEALSVLVSEMENHRSDFVVIMAGYEKEMDEMMSANIGLDSRMPYKIVFDSYSGEQLFAIFMKMAGDEFGYTAELEAAAKKYFLSIPEEFIGSREFSNARFVRNLYERCQRKMLTRCMEKGGDVVMDACDFEEASSDKDFKFNNRSVSVGF